MRFENMTISVTKNAAQHIQKSLNGRGNGIGLRLGIKQTGCSGFMYIVDYVDELSDNDQVFESLGVKVIVDGNSLGYLDGTEIDYGPQGLGEGFMFHNPQAKNACGCGESFNVS